MYTQNINLHIVNPAPGVPNAGAASTSSADFATANALWVVPIVLLMTFAIVLFILKRTRRLKMSKPGMLSLMFIPLFTLVGLALAQGGKSVFATSSLSLSSPNIAATVERGSSANINNSISVTTSSSAGYALSAKLNQAVAGISVVAKDSANSNIALSTTGQLVGDNNTATAGDNHNYQLTVAVDDSVAIGDYAIQVIYTAADKTVPPTTMQAMTTSYCSSEMVVGDTLTMTDTRNSQDYLVRKLADGNCWMVNNLKLGSITSTTVLTPTDTNITSNWTLPQVNAGGSPSTVSYYDQPVVDALLSGDLSYDSAKPNSSETDITSPNFAGYYYNWCAVTAGDPADPSGTCYATTNEPGDAAVDICPAGWRLPTGGVMGEFAWLNAKMNDPVAAAPSTSNFYADWQFTGPFKGVLAGGRGVAWFNQGSNGGVWSSSHNPLRNHQVFYLSLSSASATVVPDDVAARSNKLPIRCVLN